MLVPPSLSPSSSNTHLTCISPLPDMRRDSVDEHFFSTLNLPAPKEFADPNSRRCSAANQILEENEESSGSGKTVKTLSPNIPDSGSLRITYLSDSMATTAPTSATLDPDPKPLFFDFNVDEAKAYSTSETSIESEQCADYYGFTPIEVLERNLLRQQQQQQHPNSSLLSFSVNSLQVPNLNVADGLERPPENMYIGENITIIDTDVPPQEQHSSSDEQLPGEASDLLSTISNEECSVKSEILDRPSEASQINIADIIQDLDSEQIGHIDSPDNSDTTDMLHGESLFDDISSVLGHDLLGALQDNTMTEDSTLCTLERERSRKRSLKHKQQQQLSKKNEEPQYGFENRLFEISDNRHVGLNEEPKRYPSLAHFEDNDIARKSFKRPTRVKSGSFKKKQECENDNLIEAIQIQIQGSHSDLSDQETVKESIYPPHLESCMKTMNESKYSKETSEKDQLSNKKKKVPHISFVIDPPSPSMSDQDLRTSKFNEIRRHSSHTPSLLAPKEMEINRRHSGNNPNLLGLDRERMKFLNCSPAATRRISVGSLFKPNEGLMFGSKHDLRRGSTMFGDRDRMQDDEKRRDRERERNKSMPIINPLVQLPSWPSKYIILCNVNV